MPDAKFLDIILYSREQLSKEYEAMPSKGEGADLPDAPWGIISVKAQDEDHETPMQVGASFTGLGMHGRYWSVNQRLILCACSPSP